MIPHFMAVGPQYSKVMTINEVFHDNNFSFFKGEKCLIMKGDKSKTELNDKVIKKQKMKTPSKVLDRL